MRQIIVAGVIMTAVVVVLLALCQLVDYAAFGMRIHALDTDYHSSVFGIVSLLSELAAAVVIAQRARGVSSRRWAWLALAALVAMLVLVRTVTTFNASILAAPLACVLVLLCGLTWSAPAAARAVVWAALGLMVISLALHQVGLDADVLSYSNQSWAYQLTAVAKHGCELAGWLLVATGIRAGLAGEAAPETASAATLASPGSVST